MHTSFATHSQTLTQVLWPEKSNRTLRYLVFAIAGSLALALSAKISVPVYPVPFTLQTLVVLVLGFAFGPALAGATVGLYLMQGALGFPVFQGTPEKGIGLAYMMGPTGGYLLGFLVSAVFCGWLAKKGWDQRFLTMALGMIMGNLIIYVFGLAWLGNLIGWDKPLFALGMVLFLVGDAIKIALAVALVPSLWKWVNRT